MRLYTFFDQLRNHFEYAERKTELMSRPTIENIEIISDCNLRCKMCISPPKRAQRIMSLEQVMKITERNIELLRGEHVWLHHFGEPLMHSQLFQIIEYLKEMGIHTRLSTNATMLNHSKAEMLINSGLNEIVFSIDGTERDDYDYLRIGANFNQVVENVINFLRLKKEMKSAYPITQVQFINIYGSEEKAQEFVDYWHNTDVNWINVKSPSTRAMQVRDKGMRDKIVQHYMVSMNDRNFPCYWLWSSLIILSDGNVVPCCSDLVGKNVLGNVFNQDLIEIWNSKKTRKIREEQNRGDYTSSPICKNCPEAIGYNKSFQEKYIEECIKMRLSKTGLIRLNHHMLIKNAD